MKHKLSTTLALAVLTVVLAASGARAQTVANGPYYANPSWDQQLPVATRFIVLSNWDSKAVLDRETGLVWQSSAASTSTFLQTATWLSASDSCLKATTGNRLGWRLPAAQELTSLVDPTTSNLPAGHPFTLLTSVFYWTATTYAPIPSQAWAVKFGGFGASVLVPGEKSSGGANVSFWCVRGGQGLDVQ